jgi:hypothetical protein
MDARKLVGRTEGAKKRAARKYTLGVFGSEKHPYRCLSASVEYAVGFKLRPCPGKHGCVNCTLSCDACEDLIPDDTKCKRCGSVMTTEGPFCDGSGVVTAKPKKIRR